MLILVGKSCSGKDTIRNRLVAYHGFKKMVTYTDRPPRRGEKDGEAYHFVSPEEFQQMISAGFFLEWKEYHTVDGVWHYGSSLDDYDKADKKTVVILTPAGYVDFLDRSDKADDHLCVYVYANLNTITERLKKRGDKKEEAERRILKDIEDFKGFEDMAMQIVYNNTGTDIEDVIKRILENKYWED